MESYAQRKVGRRTGRSHTRQAILQAAQNLFATTGYDRTTIRAVASAAQVDPALVMHFFKNKQNLFVEATLPVHNPLEGLMQALEGDKHAIGERLAIYMVDFLEDPRTGPLATSLIRASLSEPTTSKLQNLLEQKLLDAFAEVAVDDKARLRANFVCAQYFGLAIARHINKMEPLASAPKEEIVKLLAPALQHYLMEKA